MEIPSSEPPRLFFDASVIIAGAASIQGASRALLVLAEVGLIRAVVSPFALAEVERNLRWKLPQALPYFQRIREAIPWELVADPPQTESEAWTQIVPFKDAPIIAAAVKLTTKPMTSKEMREVRAFIFFSHSSHPPCLPLCPPFVPPYLRHYRLALLCFEWRKRGGDGVE